MAGRQSARSIIATPGFRRLASVKEPGRRAAFGSLISLFRATFRPPVRRFLAPVRSASWNRIRAFAPVLRPRLALVQRTPPLVAAGEPLDGASPGSGLRWPTTGGADPSPHRDVSRHVPGGKDGAHYAAGWKLWDMFGAGVGCDARGAPFFPVSGPKGRRGGRLLLLPLGEKVPERSEGG